MAGIDNIRAGQTMTTGRSQTRTESKASERSDSAPEAKGSRDSVSLSQQGKAMGQLHQTMASQPSFDSAKVAAIKEAIANGSYRVDAERLADNMIRFENELGGL
ncbi:flagellar biosynthesis anti-sigma factor FlgM [Vibrio sp. HA2012]|uniref:flagellar biosynthesis anti-sigma factor FlgM n=1 Tax=Vibrio sp. HA2012 TaxID=1971595 RepID=UPI000C2C968A|nr:flagellar biosynthesis anti-sigma factor FlgM [Vibrio sp. HA2012]PJC86004.1 flagellar biosynthesis anti-sigma factor FlgM [Vibrio sp. HA2012]